MKQRAILGWVSLLFLALLLVGCGGGAVDDPLRIGLNLELTGDIPAVGEHSRAAAEMFVEQINEAGGLEMDGGRRMLELAVADNA